MFGHSLAAHHLLYSYLAVWIIQGGYAGWIAFQWMRSRRSAMASAPTDPETREDF
jgi:hypothetical protein